MKKLTLVALSVFVGAAMAHGPAPVSEIRISGTSVQVAAVSNAAVINVAHGNNAAAHQNLASNTGDVTIRGNSVQVVAGNRSVMVNTADANTFAQQNLSSNVGKVTVGGTSVQATLFRFSYIANHATGRDAVAVQNIATNNACFACATVGGRGGH